MSAGYIPPPFSAQYAHVLLGYTALGVNISGTTVTLAGAGATFPTDGSLNGQPIHFGVSPWWGTISSVTNSTTATLTASAGSHTNIQVTFYRELNQADSCVILGSIDYESSLTTRPTFNFDAFYANPGSTVNFSDAVQVAQPVLLIHDTYGRIFGGSVDQTKTTNYPGTNAVKIACQCVSWDAVLTRRLLINTGAFSIGSITQDFTGDGSTSTFNLSSYPSQIVSVTVNGIAKSFGGSGSTGAYLTWAIDTYPVTTSSPVPNGQVLSVQYNTPGSTVQLPIYTQLTADQIVEQLIDTIEASEGLPWQTVVSGPLVDSIQFTTQDTVDSALQSLCEYINDGTTNYWYFIDAYKYFQFEIQGVTTSAPFNINTSDGSDLNFLIQVTLTTSRDQFANAAWADIAKAVGGSYAANSWMGDGSTRSFQTTYGISSVDTALGGCNLFNGTSWVAQTVGITGSSGYDWYYTVGDATLTQDAGGTTLTSSQTLQFLYFPTVTISQQYYNQTSIPEIQIIEGGSGEYDLYIDMSDNNPVLATATVAANQATYYAGLSQVLEVVTYRGGLVSGQSIFVHIPQIGAGGFSGQTFVVDSVKITDEDGLLKWTVSMDNGAIVGGWKRAMVRLANLL